MSLGEPEDFHPLEEAGMRAVGALLAVLVLLKALTWVVDFLSPA